MKLTDLTFRVQSPMLSPPPFSSPFQRFWCRPSVCRATVSIFRKVPEVLEITLLFPGSVTLRKSMALSEPQRPL